MTYDRFEDPPGWQEAARLYESAEDLLENECFHASRGFRDHFFDKSTFPSSNEARRSRIAASNLLRFFLLGKPQSLRASA